MALSGNYKTNKYTTSSHGDIGLNLTWTGTQSIANNTTTIKWTLKSYGSMSSGYYVQAGPVTVTINGTKVLNTTSRFSMKGDGAYKKSGTITIPHNADGSKTITLSVAAAIYSTSVNCRYPTGGGSASIQLDKIDRYALIASVTDFNNAAGTTDNPYPTIVYTNPAGTTLTTGLKARITWNDTSGIEQASSWVTLNDEGGSYTFDSSTLTAQNIADMLAACPDSNTLSVKFQLRSTMGGVDYDDYKTATMNVVNAAPSFSVNPSYEDVDDDIVDNVTHNNQIIVQKQSTLHIYPGTAGAQKGASLLNSPYVVNFNGNNYVPDNGYVSLEKPDIAGTFRATVTATDTRGNTATAYVDITVLEWAEPTLDCGLERQNSFESNCDLSVTPHFSLVNNLNSITITEKHKRVDLSSWSEEDDITNKQSPIEIFLLNNYEWEMIVTITDKFTSKEYRLVVGKGIPYIYKDFYRNSLAFNAIPDSDNQVKIGDGCHAKVNGVTFPHVYSTTEQIVGYWIDGRPIYKRVIELTTDISVNANTWKNSALTVEEDIIVIDSKAMYYSSQYDMFSVWNFIAAQTNTSNKKAIDLYNPRDAACNVNRLIIEYIKPTQNNN